MYSVIAQKLTDPSQKIATHVAKVAILPVTAVTTCSVIAVATKAILLGIALKIMSSATTVVRRAILHVIVARMKALLLTTKVKTKEEQAHTGFREKKGCEILRSCCS